jgi:hypothetical protein
MHQHSEYSQFVVKMGDLNGKHPDFGGSMNGALVRHHMDPQTVKSIVSENMTSDRDIVVEEVTRESLKSSHFGYKGLVEKYFLPHDTYPNIE